MAFTFNGKRPDRINVVKDGNTTSLNILKYGNTPVWGRRYGINFNEVGARVDWDRLSSPNEHAELFNSKYDERAIYYGDVLRFRVDLDTGYELQTFTINGVNWTNNREITVTSKIDVKVKGKSVPVWRRIWTGSNSFTIPIKSTSYNVTIGTGTSHSPNHPIRISGKVGLQDTKISFTLEKGQSIDFENIYTFKFSNYSLTNVNRDYSLSFEKTNPSPFSKWPADVIIESIDIFE